MLHEVAECDCADEFVGCAGEADELGASRASVPAPASARSSRSTTPWRAGVVGGLEDEAGSCGLHCPGLVSVHFRTAGCSFVCSLSGAVTHVMQRVLVTPLRQCLLQKCLQQTSQVRVAKVKHSEQHVASSICVGCVGACVVFGVDAAEICEVLVGVVAVGAVIGARHGEINAPSIA